MLIIDRFEDKWAVITHEEQVFNLPRSVLPKTAKEGDVIQITVEKTATANHKKKAESLLENFFDE